MANNDIFSATVRVISSDERDALVSYGAPARPVLIPIAAADFEPLTGEHGAYRITMDRGAAKDLGLDL